MWRFEGALAKCRQATQGNLDFGNPLNEIGAYRIEQEMLHEAMPRLGKVLFAVCAP